MRSVQLPCLQSRYDHRQGRKLAYMVVTTACWRSMIIMTKVRIDLIAEHHVLIESKQEYAKYFIAVINTTKFVVPQINLPPFEIGKQWYHYLHLYWWQHALCNALIWGPVCYRLCCSFLVFFLGNKQTVLMRYGSDKLSRASIIWQCLITPQKLCQNSFSLYYTCTKPEKHLDWTTSR